MHLSVLTLLATSLTLTLSSASLNQDLTPRDGVGAAAGAVPAPSPTQMSPATTYLVHGPGGDLVPMPYTQKFVAVPDPWPAPTAGTIGLGTIQGVIGVVKTESSKNKRQAEPTGGVVAKFARGVVVAVRRSSNEQVRGGGRGDGTRYDASYTESDSFSGSGAGSGTAKHKSDGGSSITNGAERTSIQGWRSTGFVAAVTVVLGALVAL